MKQQKNKKAKNKNYKHVDKIYNIKHWWGDEATKEFGNTNTPTHLKSQKKHPL